LSPVGVVEALLDLKWLATTVKVIAPEVNVCAIGSRALDHTVSSLIDAGAPFGVTFGRLEDDRVVMKSCWAAAGSSAGDRT
jgi:hypothetical protein